MTMTHEHGTGRGGGRRGRGTVRYIEASLLVMLARQPAHGHELNERLGEVFPLADQLPDISTIYRSLADLEAQGAVSAEWTPGDGGGRKVYQLTPAGKDLLVFWGQRFKEEQAGLQRLLAHFNEHEQLA